MKKFTLMVLTMLVAAGCGASDRAGEAVAEQILEQVTDGDVDISTDDGELILSVEGDDGTGTFGFKDELPDGFPFPTPDEYTLGMSMTFDSDAGTSYSVVVETAADEFDAVADMYESWMEGEGFTVDVTRMGDDTGKLVMLLGERDDVSAGVAMTQEAVSNDDAGNVNYATVITLSWDPKE